MLVVLDIMFVAVVVFCVAKLADTAEAIVKPDEAELRRREIEDMWRRW